MYDFAISKESLEQNNSCFIDPFNLEPFADQWEFLKNIRKISVIKLNEVFDEITTNQTGNMKSRISDCNHDR
jgi:hypothetical protein